MLARITYTIRQHKLLFLSFIFFFAFSGIVSVFADENSGGYTPGESLNPTCAPGSLDCLVVLSGSIAIGDTVTDGTARRMLFIDDSGNLADITSDNMRLEIEAEDDMTAYVSSDFGGRFLVRDDVSGNSAFSARPGVNGTLLAIDDSEQSITGSINGFTTISISSFFGIGLDDMTSGGTYTGNTSSEYFITIDGEGTPDTFSWTDGTTTENNVSITGGEQELSDGVVVTFTSTTGHTSGDQWHFSAVAYASQSFINSKLALTTNMLGEDYPFVGSMIDDTANSGIGAVTGILQTDEGSFISSYIIDQVNMTRSGLEMGTNELNISVLDSIFGSADLDMNANDSESIISLRSEGITGNNMLTLVNREDGNISEGSGILLSSSNGFDPVTGGYFGVVLGDFIRGSANDGYLSAGMAINTNDDSGNNLFLQGGASTGTSDGGSVFIRTTRNDGSSDSDLNTYSSIASFTSTIASLGDVDSIGNDTLFTVDDANQTIDGFAAETVTFGSLGDTAMQINVAGDEIAFQTDGEFNVTGTGVDNDLITVDFTSQSVFLGDHDGGIGNETLLTVDDTNRTIVSSTMQLGIGSQIGVSATSVGLEYSDGTDSWSWFASGDGYAGVEANGVTYQWPNTDGAEGDVLTINTTDGITSELAWETPVTSPITIENSTSLFSTGLTDTGTNSGATNSIFLGEGAGYQTPGFGVYNANFLGLNAGYQATSALNSNFFGYYSGFQATTANNSNFFGAESGRGAVAANNSNFFGNGAGYSANSANNSNFFGDNAGQNADNASSSNFFGASAGESATDASYSNFLGSNTGYGAARSDHSNFIGQYAGFFATDAPFSNFIGTSAGQGATYSAGSNFIGYNAGQYSPGTAGSEYANNSIFIGTNAGYKAGDLTLDNSVANITDNCDSITCTSILIGDDTSTGGFSNSIAVGYGATNTISGEFLVDDDYDYFNFNGARYLMPSDNGDANEVLTVTDADGTLSWEPVSGGSTLDGSYDFGGAGVGRTITADSGAVLINGEDGFQVTGTFGVGDAIDVSGAGTRMFFNPATAAFRAGNVDGNQWNSGNVGNYSMAMGWGTTASGIGSFASGTGTTASNYYATAMGQSTVASGTASFAAGQGSTVSGASAIGLGTSLTVSGDYAVAFGINSTASGARAITMGNFTAAKSYNEIAMGRYNTDYTPASTSSWNAADRLFVLGNGISTGVDSHDAFTILKSGITGIGFDNFETTGDVDLLQVNGSILQSTATACTLNADADGTIICTPSDEKLKHNIENISYGLDTINQLRPVTYEFNDSSFGNGSQIGFIAQELEQFIPEVVTDGPDYKSVNYPLLTSVITKAIQEMDLKIVGIQNFTDETFLGKIRDWFASAANGITEFIAGTIRAKNELCVGGTCVTESQLIQLLQNSGQQSSGGSGGTIIPPEDEEFTSVQDSGETQGIISEENTETEVIVEETPEEIIQDEEPVVEESPQEEPTPEPEPTPEVPAE